MNLYTNIRKKRLINYHPVENKWNITKAIQKIRKRIDQACVKADRKPEEIRIMGVSKHTSVESMEEAFYHGITLFGENRISSALPKILHFHSNPSLKNAEFQFIGHLQTNKINKIIPAFSAIQSVSDKNLAQSLDQRVPSYCSPYPVLLEIKTSDEENKHGWLPEKIFDDFPVLATLSSLSILGLMTMAPFVENEKAIRESFITLRETKEKLEKNYAISLPILSMGMSRDYTIAIEEGSNMIRIGNALFGG